jgi:hypothetical protein
VVFMVFHTTSGESFKEWEEPTLKMKLGSIPAFFENLIVADLLSFKGHIQIQAVYNSRWIYMCINTKEKFKSEYNISISLSKIRDGARIDFRQDFVKKPSL